MAMTQNSYSPSRPYVDTADRQVTAWEAVVETDGAQQTCRFACYPRDEAERLASERGSLVSLRLIDAATGQPEPGFNSGEWDEWQKIGVGDTGHQSIECHFPDGEAVIYLCNKDMLVEGCWTVLRYQLGFEDDPGDWKRLTALAPAVALDQAERICWEDWQQITNCFISEGYGLYDDDGLPVLPHYGKMFKTVMYVQATDEESARTKLAAFGAVAQLEQASG